MPSSREVKSLQNLLTGLPRLSGDKIELVKECFAARKTPIFDTLAQLSGDGKPNSRLFNDIRHLLGRLGEHFHTAKTLVIAALRFPAILDDFKIERRGSPPSRCIFQSPDEITLEGISSRIFTKETDVTHYPKELDILNKLSDGALLGRLRQDCCFKTRVHAELLLVDHFYWKKFEYLDDDPYIGCSKPACFNCYQYFLAHPSHLILPASHNKLYLAWRTPDILAENVSVTTASKIREEITRKMNSSIRAELRRQIDGKRMSRTRQFDSVTGTISTLESVSEPLLDVTADDSNAYFGKHNVIQ